MITPPNKEGWCSPGIYSQATQLEEGNDNIPHKLHATATSGKNTSGVLIEIQRYGVMVKLDTDSMYDTKSAEEEHVKPGQCTHYKKDSRYCTHVDDVTITAIWITEVYTEKLNPAKKDAWMDWGKLTSPPPPKRTSQS